SAFSCASRAFRHLHPSIRQGRGEGEAPPRKPQGPRATRHVRESRRHAMEFTRNNPLTGEAASSATAMKAGDIAPIAAKAQEGFKAWSTMGPNARRAVLMKAAAALEARADAFVDAMMGEIGATKGWALFNLN